MRNEASRPAPPAKVSQRIVPSVLALVVPALRLLVVVVRGRRLVTGLLGTCVRATRA
jgi:hypothetical protein